MKSGGGKTVRCAALNCARWTKQQTIPRSHEICEKSCSQRAVAPLRSSSCAVLQSSLQLFYRVGRAKTSENVRTIWAAVPQIPCVSRTRAVRLMEALYLYLSLLPLALSPTCS